MLRSLLLILGFSGWFDLCAQGFNPDSAHSSFTASTNAFLSVKPSAPTWNNEMFKNQFTSDSTRNDSSKKLSGFNGSVSLENLYYTNESDGPFPHTIFTTLNTTNGLSLQKYPFQVSTSVVLFNGKPEKELSSIDFGIDKEQLLNKSKEKLEAKVKGAKADHLESLLPGSNFIKDSLDQFNSLQSTLKLKATAAANQYVEFVKDSLRIVGDTLSSKYRHVDSCSAYNNAIKKRYAQLLSYREKYNAIVTKHKDKLAKYDSLVQKIRAASNFNGLRNAFKRYASLDSVPAPEFKALDFVDGFNIGGISLTGDPLLIRNFSGNGVDFSYEKDKYFMQAVAGWEKPFEARTFQLHRPQFKPVFPDKRLAYVTTGLSGDESKTAIHVLFGSWKQSQNTLFAGTNLVVGISEERELSDAITLNAFAATSTRWPKDQINESSNSSLFNLNNAAATGTLSYEVDRLRTDIETKIERIGSQYYTIGNPFLMRGTTLSQGKQKTRVTRWLRVENELAYKRFDGSIYGSMNNSVRRKHSTDIRAGKFSTTNLSYEKEVLNGNSEFGQSQRITLIGSQTVTFTLGKNANAVTNATYLENRMSLGGISQKFQTRAISLTQSVLGKKYSVSTSYMMYQSDTLSTTTASATASLNISKKLTVAHTSTYTNGLFGPAYLTNNTIRYGFSERLLLQTLICGKYFSSPIGANTYGSPYFALTITYSY